MGVLDRFDSESNSARVRQKNRNRNIWRELYSSFARVKTLHWFFVLFWRNTRFIISRMIVFILISLLKMKKKGKYFIKLWFMLAKSNRRENKWRVYFEPIFCRWRFHYTYMLHYFIWLFLNLFNFCFNFLWFLAYFYTKILVFNENVSFKSISQTSISVRFQKEHFHKDLKQYIIKIVIQSDREWTFLYKYMSVYIFILNFSYGPKPKNKIIYWFWYFFLLSRIYILSENILTPINDAFWTQYFIAARAASRGTPRRRRPGPLDRVRGYTTRISDSEKRSFSARRTRACRQTKSVGGMPSAAAAGSSRGSLSSWSLHARARAHTLTHKSLRGLNKMQKRQRQDPRMIFRTRNEPVSCPATWNASASASPFRYRIGSGKSSSDIPINNGVFSAYVGKKVFAHRRRCGKSASDTLDLSNCASSSADMYLFCLWKS